MTSVAQISKTFMNKRCIQPCIQRLLKYMNFVSDLKTAFLSRRRVDKIRLRPLRHGQNCVNDADDYNQCFV